MNASPSRVIAGIDEAGRGPVIGPLVVAMVFASPVILSQWAEVGITDSKRLSRASRERLYQRITREAIFWTAASIPAQFIEVESMDSLLYAIVTHWIRERQADEIFLDAMGGPGSMARWVRSLQASIPYRSTRIIMKAKADREETVVGAASIIAKVLRDDSLTHLKNKYGDFGWGYPSEIRTVRFLESWYTNRGSWPPWVRTRWETCRRIHRRLRPWKP